MNNTELFVLVLILIVTFVGVFALYKVAGEPTSAVAAVSSRSAGKAYVYPSTPQTPPPTSLPSTTTISARSGLGGGGSAIKKPFICACRFKDGTIKTYEDITSLPKCEQKCLSVGAVSTASG